MSLKPAKKSDLNKGWMSSRKSDPKKIQPEYHLIVTEGTKTEPLYFQGVKESINQTHPERVQLEIVGTGYNTISLFEKAKQMAESSANGYKHVWVIYDTDDFPAENVNATVDLCRDNSNSETHYHPIWSNQCIELWYLLHFCFFQSDIERKDYYPKLSWQLNDKGLGTYRKNREDMYAVLLPYLDTAIKNAKRLAEINGDKYPASAAPGTAVYQLMEKLRPYL